MSDSRGLFRSNLGEIMRAIPSQPTIQVLVPYASAAVILLSACNTSERPTSPGTFAFVHATVIDATGAAPKRNQTVVVSGDRIAEVGDSADVAIPSGARVIDAAGKFLIPGLWDLHVHTRYEGIDHLRLLLVNGITTARDMGGPWSHLNIIKRWRDEIARGERIGPRLLTGGPLLDGADSPWSHAAEVPNEEEGRRVVRRLSAEGADFAKVYSGLTRESFFAIADEARSVGLPVVGHVPNAVSVTEASDAGQRSVEHMTGILLASSSREDELRSGDRFDPVRARALSNSLDPSRLEALAALLRRNGTSVVPTLSNGWTRLGRARQDEGVLEADRLRYVPEAYRTAWTRQQPPSVDLETIQFEINVELVGLLHAHGVSILAGTDVVKPFFVPGFSLHDELGLLVSAGLSEMEAIQAATRDAARFVGMDDVGTIQRDMIADLLLLDADPLENIENTRRIAAVMSTGRLIERSELLRIHAQIADSAANWTGVPTGR